MHTISILIFEITFSLLPALFTLLIQAANSQTVEFTGRELYVSALIVSVSTLILLLGKVGDPDADFSLSDFLPSITLLSILGGMLLLTILIAVSVIRSVPLMLTALLWANAIVANGVVRYVFLWSKS